MRLLTILTVLLAAGSLARAGETKFASKPSATKAGNKVKIAFAAGAPTDVEVSVLDAKGKVIRHLAAGALGGKSAPPAPLKSGLKQELEWDGRDDKGKPAAGGPFKVRVRLGLGVKLDGFIGEDPRHMPTFGGLAVDVKGRLYVLWSSTSAGCFTNLTVFDRKGKYIKTLMPMPADLPAAKTAGFNLVKTGNGHPTPRNYEGAWPVLYSVRGQVTATRVPASGALLGFDGRNLCRIGPDGGTVGGWFARRAWAKKIHHGLYKYAMHRPGAIAAAPDGKTAYVTGVWQKKPFGPVKTIVYPPNRIYRITVEGGKLEKFADVKGASKGLGSMAVDGEGNLLVADPAGKRIVVLSPAGKQLESIPSPVAPRLIARHRKSGAIYVLGGGANMRRGPATLVKLTGKGAAAKEAGRLALPRTGRTHMALDDSAEPPVIWLASGRTCGGSRWSVREDSRILRLEDRGTSFVETEHLLKPSNNHAASVTRLAVHPENDLVVSRSEFTHAAVYQGLTGKRIKAPFKHCLDMGVGLDGNWYVQTGYTWCGPLHRYGPGLEPMGSAPVVKQVFGRWGWGFGSEGLACDQNGRIYLREQLCQHTVCPRGIVVHGPDGKPENHGRLKEHKCIPKHKVFPGALFAPTGRGGGVAVDWKGYMYIGLRGSPPGHKPPAGFEKDPAYHNCTGSVVKVDPKGGATFDLGGAGSRPHRKEKKVPAGMKGLKLVVGGPAYPRGTCFVEGGVKAYPGLGGIAAPFGGGCTCRQPMFQLDGWGRLWMPNAQTFSVNVVDNEGNPVLGFGKYGNVDSRGSGETSPIKKPEIPLGWPEAVGVSYKAVYVADVLNRRIVRLKKTYAAEETCAVK